MRWLILVGLLSCKGDWVTEVEREPFLVKHKVECHKTDICHRCGWDLMSDEYKCGVKKSKRCPGTKWVLVEVTPYEGFYKNRPDEYLKLTRERQLHDLSECE